MSVKRTPFIIISCVIIAAVFSSCVSPRIEPIITIPSGLFATQKLSDEIIITWDAVEGSDDIYLLETQRSSEEGWIPLAMVQSEHIYIQRDVDDGLDRFYRIALSNSKGEQVSPWSAPVIGRQSKESHVTKILLPVTMTVGVTGPVIAVDGNTIWVVYTEVSGVGAAIQENLRLLVSHNQGESWLRAVTLDTAPAIHDLVLQSYGGMAHLVYTVPSSALRSDEEVLRYVRISKEGTISAFSDVMAAPMGFDALDMVVGYKEGSGDFHVMVLFIETNPDKAGGVVGYVISTSDDLDWKHKVTLLETKEAYDRSRAGCSLSMREDGTVMLALDMGALSGLYGAQIQLSTGRLASEPMRMPLELLCCDIVYQNFTAPRLQHDGERFWMAVSDIGYEAVNVYSFWLEDGLPAGEVHVSLAVGTWTNGSYEDPRIILFGETPFIGYTHARYPSQDGRRTVVAFTYGGTWYPFFINSLPVKGGVSLATNGKYVFAVFSENLDMAEGSSAQLVFARSDTSGTAWTRL